MSNFGPPSAIFCVTNINYCRGEQNACLWGENSWCFGFRENGENVKKELAKVFCVYRMGVLRN